MTGRDSLGLDRPIKTKAEVAAECRAAAAEYDERAARATALGNQAVAAHFTTLADGRRQRAAELEAPAAGGKG